MNPKIHITPYSWITQTGHRLDCGPYGGSAVKARMTLLKLGEQSKNLEDVLTNGKPDIVKGPMFTRAYVNDEEIGYRFLGTSSMLRADLKSVPLFSRKAIDQSDISTLKVQPYSTLITRSGTIGRMTYCRPDMIDCVTSEHVLHIRNPKAPVKAGYLHAFFTSSYGLPQVTSGTYGAIIRHIEPEHLLELKVPILKSRVINRTSDLMDESANLLANYQAKINESTELFFKSVGLSDISKGDWHSSGPDLGFSASIVDSKSLRALNFNPRLSDICDNIRKKRCKTLREVCLPGTVSRGQRFLRVDADPEFAYQMIGQKQIFFLHPEGRWIAKSAIKDGIVEDGTILVAARGTLGESELYCRGEFITGNDLDRAYSEDFLRLIANEEVMPRGCLFAFMRSETAFRMLRSISTGTKLQDHHPELLNDLPIPMPPKEACKEIDKMVRTAYVMKQKAIANELEAVRVVEAAIDKAANG